MNCASIGCPSLYQEAFKASQLDAQLNYAAINFINNKSKNYYDKKNKVLYLFKIFNWYGADFNHQYGGYLKYVSTMLKIPQESASEWLDYNWKLNETTE